MANYFNLTYESTAASSPGNVELNYGNSTSDGLTVQASLYAGSDFTPTHYKIWGIELVEGGGVVTMSGAEWISYTDSRTVRLARHNDPQYAYVKFKDVTSSETETFQSNAVTFSFVEPVTHHTTEWKTDFEDLGFNSTNSNILRNVTYNTEVEFSKSNIGQLSFSARDFSGLVIQNGTISISSSSQIGQILELSAANKVGITKVFDQEVTPLIMVDDGSGYTTLTAYDGENKSTISGTNATRLSNVGWAAGTKTLSFDVNRFSTYGFTTITKMEFTSDSQTAAYVGGSVVVKVYVQDGNGESVESAPVTLSGTGDSIGSIQESMPVNTNALGIAQFTINISSAGSAVYEANVDNNHFTDPDLTIFGVGVPTSSQRSLLTQYEQIYRTYSYSDTVSGVNTVDVAEPTSTTVSGSSDSVIEHDMNVLRTLLKQVKGTSDWFSSSPTYFKPDDTNISSDELGSVTLNQIAGNTLDSKTVILAISDSNSGSGFSIGVGDEGFLFSTILNYAIPTNRIGLPIFNTTNSGTYYDEGGSNSVVGIDVIDLNTGGEFRDSNGDIVYAKFHDGSDYGGSGDGTDAYVKFYTDEGPYTTVSGDHSSVMLVYPYRKLMSSMEEYEWLRTDFVTSWEGDSALINDISDFWSYTGALDNESSPSWAAIAGSPMVSSSQSSLYDAINAINDGFSNRVYLEENYISSGESFTDSIDKLDMAIKGISELASEGIAESYSVVVISDITAGTAYQLPVGVSYTPDSTEGRRGSNMDVYLNGQLLIASTGINGANEDGDYAETSPTHITFHFDVYQYSNITFKVRS